jgi:hypothetical protein
MAHNAKQHSSHQGVEHPVWVSLDNLLQVVKSGEEVANRYLKEDELTSIEFLSACASQAAFISSWQNRVKLLQAVKVAIGKDKKRVFGFAESLFKELLNSTPFDENAALEMVSIYVDIMKIIPDISVATQGLLRCLYDPILTRIVSSDKAQHWGKIIIDVLECELDVFTIQKLLLFQKFREREDLEENDSDSTLTEWENTTDSTDSSIEDHGLECPVEASAAAAWILAPQLLDPPVLNSYGRFTWTNTHARYLLRLPSNTLAAQRGLELLASFGSVRFPTRAIAKNSMQNEEEEENSLDEAYDTITAAFAYVSSIQSTEARDVVADFIKSVEPIEIRAKLMIKLSKDELLAPPIRGYAIDLLRRETMKHEKVIPLALRLTLNFLDMKNQDDQIVMASLSCLYSVGVRAKNGDDACLDWTKLFAVDVYSVVDRIWRSSTDMEAEITRDDSFQLKLPCPVEKPQLKGTLPAEVQGSTRPLRTSQPPPGATTPQADLGRARLIAGAAEPLLTLWKNFLPAKIEHV